MRFSFLQKFHVPQTTGKMKSTNFAGRFEAFVSYLLLSCLFTSHLNVYILAGRPPAFACHKTSPNTRNSVITYDDCKVETNGMNPRTGIFTVKV